MKVKEFLRKCNLEALVAFIDQDDYECDYCPLEESHCEECVKTKEDVIRDLMERDALVLNGLDYYEVGETEDELSSHLDLSEDQKASGLPRLDEFRAKTDDELIQAICDGRCNHCIASQNGSELCAQTECADGIKAYFEGEDLLKAYVATGYTPEQILKMQSDIVDLQTELNKLKIKHAPKMQLVQSRDVIRDGSKVQVLVELVDFDERILTTAKVATFDDDLYLDLSNVLEPYEIKLDDNIVEPYYLGLIHMAEMIDDDFIYADDERRIKKIDSFAHTFTSNRGFVRVTVFNEVVFEEQHSLNSEELPIIVKCANECEVEAIKAYFEHRADTENIFDAGSEISVIATADGHVSIYGGNHITGRVFSFAEVGFSY